uniref:hypothetical protein n=2 Tax=Gelidibacter sp. TaxID=2018083 RepID=UPI00404B9FEC
MKKLFFLLFIINYLSCSVFKDNANLENLNNKANSNSLAMKGYQPIDPIQLIIKKDDTLNLRNILNKLPNEATRVAIGKINSNGTVTFGPFSVAKAGESYSVIIDYIKYTTTSIPVQYEENYSEESKKEYSVRINNIKNNSHDPNANKVIGLSYYSLRTNHGEVKSKSNTIVSSLSLESGKTFSNEIKLPVYVGVGLRIQASVTTLKDSVNLGSLYGLGLAASQNKLNGTLIIQTLGISGENISQIVPIPDRINESTIQTALQSLATIKSKIYDVKTIIRPQIVAFNLPFSVEGAKGLIESSLHSDPPVMIIEATNEIHFDIPILKTEE